MYALKIYQEKALHALDAFFQKLRRADLATAWAECAPVDERTLRRRAYDAEALGPVPAVCVRIPTGGGKTYLAAHAVARIGRALMDTDAPVALWLTPSDAIRAQTLHALSTPRHPCRVALESHFGSAVRVCALEELATVGPQHVGASAILVVATIQSFNVKDTGKRTVYADDENLAPHFKDLPPALAGKLQKITAEDLRAQPYLTPADIGRVKTSVANWITKTRPLVIVDEAHNNRTDQAFRMLRSLQPAGVVELTATPADDSNVLYHVGAAELQREDMIKLPIVLTEHATGWQDAVRDAILTRHRLEAKAAGEHPDYIRPVLLFQSEPKNGEVTVEKLLDHLTSPDGEKLAREEIAVATGEQKELADIRLADPACPIRYVITVEALKEGWDCPFAYVLCTLQDAGSAKDVEQLLGRILRMPYARARRQPELAKAYAHVVKTGFSNLASTLADRLVDNMGFNPYEAARAFVQEPAGSELPIGGEGLAATSAPAKVAVINLPSTPDKPIPESLREAVEIRPTMNGGATAIVKADKLEEVGDFLLDGQKPKDRAAVEAGIEREKMRLAADSCPARTAPFAPIPQLCFRWDDDLQLVESRVLAALGEFSLLNEPVSLAAFSIRETADAFEISLEDGKIAYDRADIAQLEFNATASAVTEQDLVGWLDSAQCRQIDISQPDLRRWLTLLVSHLIRDRGLTVTALVRAKHQLAEAIRKEIDLRRGAAEKKGFQLALPDFVTAPAAGAEFRYGFTFHREHYPAKPPYYSGARKLKKHYYDRIHDLRHKHDSGRIAEEFECAEAINDHPEVKHWVRNVEREPALSFWLPTATDKFYPDFVAELNDGKILVVEYKGEPYKSNDDSREKIQIGSHWEKTSRGRGLFLFAVKEDEQGRDVRRQVADKIKGRLP